MRRRDFLAAMSGSALLGGCQLTLEQGLMNECRSTSAGALLRDPLVAAAWSGVRPDRAWDTHAHVFGNGRRGSGIWLDPAFDRSRTPAAHVRRVFFMNAACAGDDDERLDENMLARLTQLVDAMPPGAKVVILAFDFTYDEGGRKRADLTTFSVPDAYARRVVQMRPDRFEWMASVHPYRADAIEALESAKAGGARGVKWLPPTMGIDLASPRCRPFYEAMRRLGLALLVHVGEEQAVHGAGRADLANPLALRHPLEQGVRVIAAHCASLGASPDLDANRDAARAPRVESFLLFERLMAERRFEGLLYGDISAVTQSNRAGTLPKLIGHADWDGRLLNGSDYPLPGVMPLFSMKGMVAEGVLDERIVPALRDLRQVNALMFDFVLKRNLRWKGRRLPASIFETRGFFEEVSSPPPTGSDRGSG